MLTKKKTYELIAEMKTGGDPASYSKHHPTIVYEVAELVRNWLIEAEFNKTRNESSYNINGEFISAFRCVPVEYECETDRYYSKLPARIISLPKNRGLRSVSPMKGEDFSFAIESVGTASTFRGLEADDLAHTECYVESDRVYYRRLDHNNITEVLIRMVASIEDLDENAPLPIPASSEALFLQKIMEMLDEEKHTPQDKHNDSNDQTVT